jgi:putative exosortase-associated protein (TIGR04073 family)
MRISSTFLLMLLVLTCVSNKVHAEENQRSDLIIEKMAYKLSRGITNVATCIVELPKQTILTTRDKGGIGWVIGPLKGIGMTAYRAFTGVTETVFFMVPQPGYYNSMIDPEFVWNGWDDTRVDRPKAQ